jgi:hypothetical protein
VSPRARKAVQATQGPESPRQKGGWCGSMSQEQERGNPRTRHPWVEAFEKAQMRQEPADYFRNLRIVEALLQEALVLGVLPLEDPLEGIEVDIRLAQVINVHTSS